MLLWSEEHSRWLSGREMLLCNSFPVTDTHLELLCGANKQPLCSYNVSRVIHGFRARDRVQMAHQSGNTQNINSIGSVLQFVFMFLSFSPAPLSVCSLSLMDEDEQWTAMKRRRTSDGKSVPSANNLIPIQINFTHAVPRARCLSEVSTVESLSVVTMSSRDRSDNASVVSARSDNSKAGSSASLDCAADLNMWASAVRRKRPSVT